LYTYYDICHKSLYYNKISQNLLFDVSLLDKYDKNKMYQVYDRWPELAHEYFRKKYDQIDFKKIDHVVFCGMGGSGTIGDALSSILSKTKMHVDVVKGYHLPKTVGLNTLAVMISASGNTIETLTIMETAVKSRCKIACFSSGGKMEQYCNKNKIEFRKIPVLNSPRASFPIFLYVILNVLGDLIPVKKSDVMNSIYSLQKTQRKICSSNVVSNPSLELAKWLKGIPLIYYPIGLQAAAVRFKNSLQENAKMHAATEDIIEACHNGIVAWEGYSNFQPILIQGKDDYIKTKDLWKVIEGYFTLHKIDYRKIQSVDGSILSKIINLVYLLDYATIYRSVLRKVDPTPVKSIDYVKSKI
jgi:glucose/mannose-6-phosphate isomerase